MTFLNKLRLTFLILMLIQMCGIDATFFEFLEFFDDSSRNQNYFEADILDVPKLIESYGYEAERHLVTTDDGYILEIHRIPYGKTKPSSSPSSSEEAVEASGEVRWKRHSSPEGASGEMLENGRRPIVLMVHCILCTSSIWVMQGPEKGLGFMLADEGYDVWMMNTRGSSYGAKHVKMSSKMGKFWEFSFHEKGMYDAPATIDYILGTTNRTSLTYIGYSMGTTIFFTMASCRPEYNEKIDKMIALAPAVYIHGAKGFLPNLSKHMDLILPILKQSKTWRVPEEKVFYRHLLQAICDSSKIFMKKICALMMDIAAKITLQKMDWDRLRYYFKFFPDFTSLNCFVHFMQTKNKDTFQLFDYGYEKNVQKYGEVSPPKYNLTQVTTPVHMFYSRFDTITPAKGVARLHSELPESHLYEIDIPYFSHAHFSWGYNCKEVLYENIIALLRNGDLKP